MSAADELVAKGAAKSFPEFEVGDTVDVQVRIQEGDKTRVQVFSGTVIRLRGTGIRRNFTVRRIVQGEGVERTFPIQSPTLVGLKVKKKGKVRRARLYYLRDRVGKGTRVKERIWTEGKGASGKKKGEAPDAGDAAGGDADEA